ncbi:MAG: hypothetical protein HY362_00365 [Candidatus Aenigmarchaeota archaeon]|nr:hypothetical protein [Candidatus Aenigmarchaeota archaeon]
MKETVVSAPGKFLLTGEYLVALESDRPAYSAAINRRVFSWIGELEGRSVTINMPQFGIVGKMDIGDGGKTEVYPTSKRRQFRYIENAVEFTLRYLKEAGVSLEGMHIITLNERDFFRDWGISKSRFGSSAAATVATVGAIFSYYHRDISNPEERERIFNLSQMAHHHSQGGFGSGFDVSTSLNGSQVYTRFPEDNIPPKATLTNKVILNRTDSKWTYSMRSLGLPEGVETAIAVTRGLDNPIEMLSRVRHMKSSRQDIYGDVMNKLDVANRDFVSLLERGVRGEEIGQALTRTRLLTRELGEKSGVVIEPPHIRAALDNVVSMGGAWGAKLQGAGGGYSAIALCSMEHFYHSCGIMSTAGFTPLSDMRVDNSTEKPIGMRLEDPQTFHDLANSLGLALFEPDHGYHEN